MGVRARCASTTRPAASGAWCTGMAFVFCGKDADLDWVASELAKDILLKAMGKLGGDKHKGACRRSGA